MQRGVAALVVVMATSCVSIANLVIGGDASVDGGVLDAAGDMSNVSDTAEAGPDSSIGDATQADVGTEASTDGPPACPGPYLGAVLALPQLVGYWRLDESDGGLAADRTGKNSGAYQGSVAQGAPGLLVGDPDRAAGFDGDGGASVVIAASPSQNLQTFTIGALIQPGSLPVGSKQQLVAKTVTYWLQLVGPYNINDTPHLELGFIGADGGDYTATPGSPSLGVGAVAHVVGTYDGAIITLYVDGVLAGSMPIASAVATTSDNLYIGSWDGTSFFTDGVIDEVFISGVALDAGTVAALHRSAMGCAYDAYDGGRD